MPVLRSARHRGKYSQLVPHTSEHSLGAMSLSGIAVVRIQAIPGQPMLFQTKDTLLQTHLPMTVLLLYRIARHLYRKTMQFRMKRLTATYGHSGTDLLLANPSRVRTRPPALVENEGEAVRRHAGQCISGRPALPRLASERPRKLGGREFIPGLSQWHVFHRVGTFSQWLALHRRLPTS